MNGTDRFRLPKFLEGEELPQSYYEPQNPYVNAPECPYNLRALGNYLRLTGKNAAEMTKEELNQFRSAAPTVM